MKTISTYQELMNLDQDIRVQMSESPAFVVFNREKIKMFQQENALRLKILADTINGLMEEHVKKNEKGIFLQRIQPEGEPNTWDFKSDEDGDNFKKELDLFLGKSIEIIL